MIVVYNSSETFASVFAVSVISLFESNKSIDTIEVYLIENGISEKSRKRILEISQKYERKISIIPLVDIQSIIGADLIIPSKYSLANYGRLFVSTQLPNTVDKIIYADCDTIFVEPIQELWEMDIENDYVAMVNDCMSAGYRRILGLNEDGIYYNSGIMLINLKKWREEKIEQLFVDYIKEKQGNVLFLDQGTINATLDGKIKLLPLKFNVYTNVFAFSYEELMFLRKPTEFYDKQEYVNACNKPYVVHFTNNFYMPIRGWMKNCDHPYGKLYKLLKDLSPWADEEMWDDPRPKIKKVYSKFCHLIPKKLALLISRIIHVYLIPYKYTKGGWKY